MSGEWIKIEVSLPAKPEVIRMGRALGLSPEAICGYLIRFWGWASSNSVDGSVTQLALRDIDMIVTLQGYAQAMCDVGWLQYDKEKDSIVLPNFTRHNGESSKKRALSANRSAKYRHANSDATVTLQASPEKRREEKSKPSAPAKPARRRSLEERNKAAVAGWVPKEEEHA